VRPTRTTRLTARGVREALAKVRELCIEPGLVTPVSRRLWQVLGLWEPVQLDLTA